MTYIEVLEKRLKRKKEDFQMIEDSIESCRGGVVKNTVKQRYLELKSETRELESCLDLAKVMFDDDG